MTGKESVTNKPTGQTLGEYLANVRTSKQLSLREVEEAAGGIVSNAYLSQLEHGRINKPSPNILHSLAQVYGVPYETLMEKAGYIAAATPDQTASRRHGRVATFAKDNLTKEEEEALLEYLAFLRSKKGKRSL
ncbi:MAG: helix-turn-helix domain-containing protein [Phycisphaerales bacterium]|nr:helix-turn-helix domain-containing protein [Phycisphaerales bacterium]